MSPSHETSSAPTASQIASTAPSGDSITIPPRSKYQFSIENGNLIMTTTTKQTHNPFRPGSFGWLSNWLVDVVDSTHHYPLPVGYNEDIVLISLTGEKDFPFQIKSQSLTSGGRSEETRLSVQDIAPDAKDDLSAFLSSHPDVKGAFYFDHVRLRAKEAKDLLKLVQGSEKGVATTVAPDSKDGCSASSSINSDIRGSDYLDQGLHREQKEKDLLQLPQGIQKDGEVTVNDTQFVFVLPPKNEEETGV